MSARVSLPPLAIGIVAAIITALLDQGLKLWLLFRFDLPARGQVHVAPFFDLVMTWNTGISYGLFQQESATGQWVLLAVKVIAVVLLAVWLTRATNAATALSLGLIIGGAIGNGIDRLAYGAVADFALLYIQTARWRFNWYVFNLADSAIVLGVIGLVFDLARAEVPQKRPDPQ
jgi:signal peptidase II